LYEKFPYICKNNAQMETIRRLSRFDTRLSKEQKLYFEKAAQLGGYRSLTDFVISTVQEKAKKIINENERIIASQRDSEVFFNAITNSNPPNEKLQNAANEYKYLLSE